jgi:hypothetical protein
VRPFLDYFLSSGKTLLIGANFETPPFVRSRRQSQILILKILNVFLRLKFSPSLTSNTIEHFENGSSDCKKHNKVLIAGGPTWVRTRDLPVMSRWLFQLSYGPPQQPLYQNRMRTQEKFVKKKSHLNIPAFHKTLQLPASAGMPQFSKRLCLYLSDTLPRNTKIASDLF